MGKSPISIWSPRKELVVAAGAGMTAVSWDLRLKIGVRFLSLLTRFLWLR